MGQRTIGGQNLPQRRLLACRKKELPCRKNGFILFLSVSWGGTSTNKQKQESRPPRQGPAFLIWRYRRGRLPCLPVGLTVGTGALCGQTRGSAPTCGCESSLLYPHLTTTWLMPSLFTLGKVQTSSVLHSLNHNLAGAEFVHARENSNKFSSPLT